jgi:hypothetical protein
MTVALYYPLSPSCPYSPILSISLQFQRKPLIREKCLGDLVVFEMNIPDWGFFTFSIGITVWEAPGKVK